MADALCGPSNALQNVQKHTSVDRSLQQDRTAPRHQPSQGFRSSPLPGPSHVDAEFHAFQAGPSLGGLGNHPMSFSRPPPLANATKPILPGWATDFQNLNIREAVPPPIAQQQFRQSPLSQSPAVNWHQEFMQQQDPTPASRSLTPQNQYGRGWQPSSQPFANHSGIQNFLSPPQVEISQTASVESLFDEAAFERAFEAVDQAMEESKSKGKEPEVYTNEPEFDMKHACVDPGDVLGDYDFDTSPIMLQDPATYYADRLAELQSSSRATEASAQSELPRNLNQPSAIQADQQFRIGSDTIIQDSERETEKMGPDAEADELAKTAGQLLDNLRNEQSQKFQKSNFLELMRQLRDKEVRVEGDKMVQSPQAPHPGGPLYPSEDQVRA